MILVSGMRCRTSCLGSCLRSLTTRALCPCSFALLNSSDCQEGLPYPCLSHCYISRMLPSYSVKEVAIVGAEGIRGQVEPALTNWCHGFNSWLVLVQLRVQEQQKRLLGFDPLLSVTLCSQHGHQIGVKWAVF